MNIMFAPAFRNDPARAALRRNIEHLAKLRDAETRAALHSVTSRKPIHGELSRIQAPTLVLHGSDDTAIKVPRARAMADAIAGSRFVLIPRAGHTSTVEEPAAISAVLAEFFV